ncbi:hypothetical protein Hanom_Chr13g01228511 [Helianthus anomalus]
MTKRKSFKEDLGARPVGVESSNPRFWLGIVQDNNQKLAAERHWLLSQGFGCFLATFTQSPDFKSSLERIYQAYRNVRYQAGLKDGYFEG